MLVRHKRNEPPVQPAPFAGQLTLPLFTESLKHMSRSELVAAKNALIYAQLQVIQILRLRAGEPKRTD